MAGTVITRFTGDSADLERKQDQVRKGAEKITDSMKSLAAESRRLDRVQKQTWEQGLSASQKYQSKLNDLNTLLQKGRITQLEYNKAVDKLDDEYNSVGTAAGKAMALAKSGALSVIGVLGGVGGLTGIIQGIIHEYDEWHTRTQRITDELIKQNQEAIAFYSLQEKGTRRERAQRAIALGAGISDPGEALDIAQRFQSASGSFEKGLLVAKDLYDAVRAGLPLEQAKELATQAVVRKDDPRFYLRAAFAAGEASGRSSVEVTRAAESLSFFPEKNLGFTVAALMAEFHPENVREITMQVGKALSGTILTEDVVKGWKKLGVSATAEPAERISALMKAGISTPQKLAEFGFRDLALTGLTDLTKAIRDGHFEELTKGFQERVQQEDIIVRRRGEIEREIPEVGISRKIEELRAKGKQRDLDAGKAEALQRQLYEAIMVQLIQERVGKAAFRGFNMYDPETLEFNPKSFFLRSIMPATAQYRQIEIDARRQMINELQDINATTRRTPPVIPLPESN